MMRPMYVHRARSLDDAYRQGYYSDSISRWSLLSALEHYEPSIRTYANRTHRGLWSRGKYLTWMPHNITIPKYTIQSSVTDEILARGWEPIVATLQRKGVPITIDQIEAAR